MHRWFTSLLLLSAFLGHFSSAKADNLENLNNIDEIVESWISNKVSFENCNTDIANSQGVEGYPQRQIKEITIEGLKELSLINPELTAGIMDRLLFKNLKIQCGRPEGMSKDAGAFQTHTHYIGIGPIAFVRYNDLVVVGDYLNQFNNFGRNIHAKTQIFHELLHVADLHKNYWNKNHSTKEQWEKLEDGRYLIELDLVYACSISAFNNTGIIIDYTFSPVWSFSEAENILYSMRHSCAQGRYYPIGSGY